MWLRRSTWRLLPTFSPTTPWPTPARSRRITSRRASRGFGGGPEAASSNQFAMDIAQLRLPGVEWIESPPARLAHGVELIGEFENAGLREKTYLARRCDGQMVHMSQ